MSATRLLTVVALVGWLGHLGVLTTPEPVREAASSVEAWRDERIAVLRCRAAVLAALTSADDVRALERVEAACDDRRDGDRPARATV